MASDPITSGDDAVLRMLAGASFGPNASLTLPSGATLDADEAQALTGAYATPAGGDDGCPPDEHVWQVIEETSDGAIVECYDCGAGYEETADGQR